MRFIHQPRTGGKVNGPIIGRSSDMDEFSSVMPSQSPESAQLTPRSIGQYGRKRRWSYHERSGLRSRPNRDLPGQSFLPFMEPTPWK